jgi:hypothetical protein
MDCPHTCVCRCGWPLRPAIWWGLSWARARSARWCSSSCPWCGCCCPAGGASDFDTRRYAAAAAVYQSPVLAAVASPSSCRWCGCGCPAGGASDFDTRRYAAAAAVYQSLVLAAVASPSSCRWCGCGCPAGGASDFDTRRYIIHAAAAVYQSLVLAAVASPSSCPWCGCCCPAGDSDRRAADAETASPYVPAIVLHLLPTLACSRSTGASARIGPHLCEHVVSLLTRIGGLDPT